MVCLTVCLSYCVIVCLFYANSAAKILLFLHICKQNPKNMQNLPISALFCFILLYCSLFCFILFYSALLFFILLYSVLFRFHFSFLSHICGSSPPLLSFGISLFVSAKLGGLEMPLPLCLLSSSCFLSPFLCPLRRDLIPTFFLEHFG